MGIALFLLAELKILWGARMGTVTLNANHRSTTNINVLINPYFQPEQ